MGHEGLASEKKYLSFIDLHPFANAWSELALDDDEHAALEDAILDNPIGHPVIPGTDGLRKMRFAPRSWRTGKRGAIRVCYVCFPQHGTIVLVTAYRKNVKDTLMMAEKREVNRSIRRLDRALANFTRRAK